MGCISSKALGPGGDGLREERRNPESTNNASVEEYQREQVGKSFSTFSIRPSYSKEPNGWTDSMTVGGVLPMGVLLAMVCPRFSTPIPHFLGPFPISILCQSLILLLPQRVFLYDYSPATESYTQTPAHSSEAW